MTGLDASRIRCVLMNPLYNGWIRRHRGANETRRPATWRANPPVPDELWARVEGVRRSKTRGGGSRQRGRVDLLAGLLECVCGRRVRSDGTFADGRHRKLHPGPCEAWGSRARLADATWEAPIMAQVRGIQLDNATIAGVVAVMGSTQRPIAIDRARFERQMRELATEHVAGGISDAAYLTRLGELRTQLAAVDEGSNIGVPAERAVAWLRALGETWQHADVPQAKADLVHAIYERIVVAGPTFVSARLTPAAYAHGLALALPQVVMARPPVLSAWEPHAPCELSRPAATMAAWSLPNAPVRRFAQCARATQVAEFGWTGMSTVPGARRTDGRAIAASSSPTRAATSSRCRSRSASRPSSTLTRVWPARAASTPTSATRA
jgi:hypothetical protein